MGKNNIKKNNFCKTVDFFNAKVYNYAYRMNIFTRAQLLNGGNKNG